MADKSIKLTPSKSAFILGLITNGLIKNRWKLLNKTSKIKIRELALKWRQAFS
ncbi:MAG: hypothetical protein ACI85I_002349 [Arenicella sp.]|jgi:hypothetical protein